jgi:DNA repair exonuclease SbcCD ATPase subunit
MSKKISKDEILAKLNKKHSADKRKYDELKERYDSLLEEVNELREENEEIQGELDAALEELADIEDTVDELNDEQGGEVEQDDPEDDDSIPNLRVGNTIIVTGYSQMAGEYTVRAIRNGEPLVNSSKRGDIWVKNGHWTKA